MSDPMRAEDGYEAYFTEKLWTLIPATYRHEDGLGDAPGTLRGIIELLAGQAAILRRDQDRLWDDAFIDLCDEWAVPYIGDLVGTRMISALDARGRRIDVAKTIYYRRRKGTPRLLEELIADITPWDGTLVEAFRSLARTRHGLDPAPAARIGRYSGTPQGGLAELRRPFASTLADGPFDEYAHLPDLRRQRGRRGLWNIPKLLFFLYRLRALPVIGAVPHARSTAGTFLFDPSGRDIPLFAPRRIVPDWEQWRFPLPWELPAPIPCRLLGDAEYSIGQALILSLGPVLTAAGQPAAAADELVPLRDRRFVGEAALRAAITALPSHAALESAPVMTALLDGALVADCGKAALLPNAIEVDVGGTAVPVTAATAGTLADWSAAPSTKALVIDPERGRFKLVAGAPVGAVGVHYHYGSAGPVGAGTDDRRAGLVDLDTLPATVHRIGGGAIAAGDLPLNGALSIDDSMTYGPCANVANATALVVQADDLQRPYVRLANPWTLSGKNGTLVLNGLWIGGEGGAQVELAGDWTQVLLRRMTLDPGGTDADGQPIATVPLVISGRVQSLVIEGSILGPITTAGAGIVDTLSISDSIVQAMPGQKAIAQAPGPLTLQRVTILGDLVVERLYATETLVIGTATVADTQWGCFRFSAARAGSRLPHPFASVVLESGTVLLASARFGDPHYGQLSEAAPRAVRRGAEDGSEMGAFSALNDPILLDGLSAKIDEYMPFGLIPAFLFQT